VPGFRGRDEPPPWRELLREAVRYWEAGRVPYNLVLALVVMAWLVVTGPGDRPAFTWRSLPSLALLAGLANVGYSLAYLVDLPLQRSPLRSVWRRWRGTVWLAGLLATAILSYFWIMGEIYP
jgi:hypothetical protein